MSLTHLNKVILTVGCAATCYGAYWTQLNSHVQFQSLMPEPIVYGKALVKSGQYDKDEPKDPKYLLKFGNTGNGPMSLNDVKWYVKGKEISSLKQWIESHQTGKKWHHCTSSNLKNHQFKPFQGQSLINILTVRPTSSSLPADQAWATDFNNFLFDQQLEMEVEYSLSKPIGSPSLSFFKPAVLSNPMTRKMSVVTEKWD